MFSYSFGTNDRTERWTLVFTVNIKSLFLFLFFYFSVVCWPRICHVADWEWSVYARGLWRSPEATQKKHLDPILDQLQGKEGAEVLFDDIVAGYKNIKQDYKARVTGAKQVCAAVSFEFHPVNRVLLPVQKWDKLMSQKVSNLCLLFFPWH